MAALMASFQRDLPIDGAAIILTAASVAVSSYKSYMPVESSDFDFPTFISMSSCNSGPYKPLFSTNLHVSLFAFPLSNP
jgi:hypothetical protein